MSTLLKSMSIPLVPLKKRYTVFSEGNRKKKKNQTDDDNYYYYNNNDNESSARSVDGRTSRIGSEPIIVRRRVSARSLISSRGGS